MKLISVPLLLLAAVAASPAAAQYPVKPVRLIVALGVGGPADGAARALAESLTPALGQPVVVENRTGAEGMIGAEAVRKSPADGYTLLWGQPTNMVAAAVMRKNPPYDPVRDFTPLSLVGRLTTCLFVHPDVPARTVGELVEHARANPGKLSYAVNSAMETIAAAQISKAAGITMVRVPYKGGTSALPDLLAGRVQVGFMSASVGLPQASQGRLRALASLVSQRTPAAPDIPTLGEAGYPQAVVNPWFALFAPAGLSREVVERLSREINLAIASPEVRARLERFGVQAEGSTPEALNTLLKQDLQSSAHAVRESGIELE